ncbi:ABC transporter ATP-binding protein [Vibrio tritonius]|uniref:ABC transporter ATP-binding protein n=1 Tax=Vibrio tritonius TaxID=1435069 RepID=UPI00315D97E8
MDKLTIKAVSIGKDYQISHIKKYDYKTTKLKNLAHKLLKIGAKEKETFHALSDINFEINKGERVAIIGNNGAGKSTLLKVLSRITEPTFGYAGINGRVSSLLEVGTGFHPELTGRENIYLNGAILGMTKKEIDSKFDDIVAFSGCVKFLDTPVKRYSSGMRVRLGFAVAAHLDSEILIIDEVLAVGDMEFQKKCLSKMNEISKGEGRTIIFVSHNLTAVKNLCERGIVLNQGNMIFDGHISDAINKYLDVNKIDDDIKDFSDLNNSNAGVIFKSIKYLNIKNEEISVLKVCEDICVDILIDVVKINRNCRVGFEIINSEGELIWSYFDYSVNAIGTMTKGTNKLRFSFKNILSPGTYWLSIIEKDDREVKNRIDGIKYEVTNINEKTGNFIQRGIIQEEAVVEFFSNDEVSDE